MIDRWMGPRVFFGPADAGAGAGGGDRAAAADDGRGGAVDRRDAGAGDDDAGDGDGGDADGDPGDDDAGLGDEYLETERLLDALEPEARQKNSKTRLRRYERQLANLRPFDGVLRQADGKFITPQEIQLARAKAADMDELEGILEKFPALRQQILDAHAGRAGSGRDGAAASDAFVDPYADESKLWFDTETEGGQKFLKQLRDDAREKWELRQEIKKLQGGFAAVARGEGTRQEREVEDRWKTETLSASKAAGFTGAAEQAFVEAVYADYLLAKAGKRLNKATPKQFIDKHLKRFRELTAGQRRTTAADTSRRVAGNGARPGPQRGGAPATARETGKQAGGIKEARSSFLNRVRNMGTART